MFIDVLMTSLID